MSVVRELAADHAPSGGLFNVHLEVLSALSKPDLSITEVADLVVIDPSLAADLLRRANSAFYGCSRKITSIRDAVSLIGLEDARELVLAATVKSMMANAQTQPADDWGTDPGRDGWRMPVRGAVPA